MIRDQTWNLESKRQQVVAEGKSWEEEAAVCKDHIHQVPVFALDKSPSALLIMGSFHGGYGRPGDEVRDTKQSTQ